MLKLIAIDINVHTAKGDFGFSTKFEDGLNIIKANNSQGKSTLLSGILYGLGFEEILGAKNESGLPPSLTSAIENPKTSETIEIQYSTIKIAYSNGLRTATNIRYINHPSKMSKLIEVYTGNVIDSQASTDLDKNDYYIHDPNSAQNELVGYFMYLETFLGVKLPKISSRDGSETKLYIQYLASASIIEQRIGWGSYVSNIPYFGLKDAKQRTIEFILGMNSFDKASKWNSAQNEKTTIEKRWRTIASEIYGSAQNIGVVIKGISQEASPSFDKNLVFIFKCQPQGDIPLSDYFNNLKNEISKTFELQTSEELQSKEKFIELQEVSSKLSSISSLIRDYVSETQSIKNELQNLNEMISRHKEDMQLNAAAKKIRDIGGEFSIKHLKNSCPLCSQGISDDIYVPSSYMGATSIEDNIQLLKSQIQLAESTKLAKENQLESLRYKLENAEVEHRRITIELNIIKREIYTSNQSVSDINVHRRIRSENEQEILNSFHSRALDLINELSTLSSTYKVALDRLSGLKIDERSSTELRIIEKFNNEIRNLLKLFGFSSFPTESILIDQDRLTPIVKHGVIHTDLDREGLEREEISERKKKSLITKTETGASASDFVRLNWAFTLALREIGGVYNENHPSLIIMDEPQQHSMDNRSVRTLFEQSCTKSHQSIMAASFDNDISNFTSTTNGIEANIIKIEGKLLQPLGSK